MIKKKLYIIGIMEKYPDEPFDEFEVEARNKKEARKLAKKELKKGRLDLEYDIVDVTELKKIYNY